MQKITAFDIGLEGGVTANGYKDSICGRLRRHVLGIQNRLQKVRSARVDQKVASKPEALLAYYYGPYEENLAALPVVIFRRLE